MKDPQEILKAEKGHAIKNCTLSEVKKMYRSLHNYISFTLPSTDNDLKEISEAFQRVFGHWRIAEVQLAVQLSISGDIFHQINAFGEPLSPNHLRDVMQEYSKLKAEVILKFRRPDDGETELSQSEKDAIMVEAIECNYRNFLSEPFSLLSDNFFWHHYCNFLTQKAKINITRQTIEDAKAQAEQVAEMIPTEIILKLQGRIGRTFNGQSLDAIVGVQIQEKLSWYCILLAYFADCKKKGMRSIFNNQYQTA